MQHYPLEDSEAGSVTDTDTDTDAVPVHRRPRVLLLGAGASDAELVTAFQRLGAEVIAAAADGNRPAHAVADQSLVITLTDTDGLSALIGRLQPNFVVSTPDAVTADALTVAAQAADAEVLPTHRSLRLAADPEGLRRLAADELGLPTAPFWFAGSVAELAAVAEHAGYPLVVKPAGAARSPVAGPGQSVLVRPDDVEPAWRRAVSAGATRVLAESVVETDCAITLLTVAGVGPAGPTLDFCNPIGHRWVTDGTDDDRGGILESWQPQPLSEIALGTARSVAARIVRALGGRGLFGVELLIRGDEVYFCDVTVSPGDSGLVTLRTQRLSQFELAARAVLGLGTDTIMISPGAARLLCAAPAVAPQWGPEAAAARADALRVPESDISVFGPHDSAPRRRLAVAMATAADAETARNRAAQVSAALARMWRR